MIIDTEPIAEIACITCSSGWGSGANPYSGWVAHLQNSLKSYCKVNRPGFNSQGTPEIMTRFMGVIANQNYDDILTTADTVVINAGIWESNGWNGTAEIAPHTYEGNVRWITEHLRSLGKQVIWVNSTTIESPFIEEGVEHVNNNIYAFNNRLMQLGFDMEFPVYGMQYHQVNIPLQTYDGVHFTSASVVAQSNLLTDYLKPKTITYQQENA